ncbi:MAG: DUF2157 domain-containing protein [Bryobacteraceae bacterium]
MELSGHPPIAGQHQAQQAADRIRLLRQELATPELQQVLALTPDQRSRFDDWSRAQLAELAQQFDVDTSASQKRVSWGMRIASTLGGIAICAAVVLFFMRYWGYLTTPVQVTIIAAIPLLALAGAEFAARRERTLYFTGLLALVAFASFVMNLAVLGSIFNINSTERALLAWGAFALVVAYRYGLRLLLVLGLLLLVGYGAAMVTAQFGYRWFDFDQRPELVAFLALLVFCAPSAIQHRRHGDFPPVYRLVGAIVFFLCVISLAEWGIPSYLSLNPRNIERLYEFVGLLTSAGAIWLGIARQWNGVVNTAATAFVIFLYTRLYHWWWDWMPRYLFFAAIGGLGIALVLAFKRMRAQIADNGAPA